MRDLINILEDSKKLVLEKLPYGRSSLSPVLNQTNIDFHYGKLAKGYVDRYNNNEGDKQFNEAGAFLHNIFFQQFRTPRNANVPTGRILDLINRKFGTWVDFKKEFNEQAVKFQGAGWIYLSKTGQIKTIPNHSKRNDIYILVDLWEHAYQGMYGSNKGKYVDSMWKIMNWDMLNRKS